MSTFALATCGDSIMAGNPGPSTHPAWAPSTAYTAVVPGAASAAAALTSFVVNSGSYYACTTSHTSGAAFDSSKFALLGTGAGVSVPNWFTWLVAMALASGKTVTAVNDGSTGSTSIGWAGNAGSWGLWRFASQSHVDWRAAHLLAFLSIGTNDFSAITLGTETLTGQQVAANAINIALEIAQAGGDIVMTTCMQTANFSGAGLTAFTAFNAAIAAFCTVRGYTLLDHANVAGVSKLDGTHPDAGGHATLANADWPLVKFR